MIGIVRGHKISKNGNGKNKVVLLQVELSTPENIETVELMTPPGDESIPAKGSRVEILAPGSGYKIAIAFQDTIEPTIGEGEKLLYSQDETGKKATLYLKKDGTIEINGSADSAVSFGDLQSAISNMVSSINTAIAGAITGHAHVYSPGPSPPIPTGTGVGSAPTVTVDISGAEVPTVKLP